MSEEKRSAMDPGNTSERVERQCDPLERSTMPGRFVNRVRLEAHDGDVRVIIAEQFGNGSTQIAGSYVMPLSAFVQLIDSGNQLLGMIREHAAAEANRAKG